MKVLMAEKKGSIKEVDYDESRDRLSKDRVKKILIEALSTYNTDINIDNTSEEIRDCYRVTFPNEVNREEIIICIREMTPGGRSGLKDEQRIQPEAQQINFVFNKINEGKKAVLLGAYERDNEIILAAWKAEKSNAATPTTGVSKQIKIGTIAEAMNVGFTQQKKKDLFACAFRKEFIYFYINNSSWIHNETVEGLVNHFECSLSDEIKDKYNRIVFGAPGTGKSYRLENDREGFGENYERVTFHPNYSYSQFVGTYKPVPIKDGDNKDSITYEYVEGPFMRVLVKAMKEKNKPFLLLIEEINRANVASVFGEVFQLLDRKNGTSEYDIETSQDIRRYLHEKLKGDISEYEKIRIPSNMYIWATMNSADQGVFPMDTAFKRRWDFEYIDINDNEKGIEGIKVVLGEDEHSVEWNVLRKAINDILLNTCRVNEDKLLGPYFISKSILESDESGFVKDNDKFIKTFKSKVIMYIYEDAAGRQHRNKVFANCNPTATYSMICSEFDKIGERIFGDNIDLTKYERRIEK